MYGTVMIARLAGSQENLLRELKAWEAERHVDGYVDSRMLLADDGRTLVQSVRFTSREKYEALADDPEQDRWWRTHVVPLLDGDPQWIDGTWLDTEG